MRVTINHCEHSDPLSTALSCYSTTQTKILEAIKVGGQLCIIFQHKRTSR